MPETETRNFALREGDEETSVFSGKTPRQAALKAARRLNPAETSEDDPAKVRLREHSTEKLHVYDAWAWLEEPDNDSPDWLGDEVTQANVSKQGVVHLNE